MNYFPKDYFPSKHFSTGYFTRVVTSAASAARKMFMFMSDF
jgi:hypothetical protein